MALEKPVNPLESISGGLAIVPVIYVYASHLRGGKSFSSLEVFRHTPRRLLPCQWEKRPVCTFQEAGWPTK